MSLVKRPFVYFVTSWRYSFSTLVSAIKNDGGRATEYWRRALTVWGVLIIPPCVFISRLLPIHQQLALVAVLAVFIMLAHSLRFDFYWTRAQQNWKTHFSRHLEIVLWMVQTTLIMLPALEFLAHSG